MKKKRTSDEFRAPPGMAGPTGEFPSGKIVDEDMGELRIAVAAFPEKGIVSIDFGKAISWLGLEKANAVHFAEGILKKAAELP